MVKAFIIILFFCSSVIAESTIIRVRSVSASLQDNAEQVFDPSIKDLEQQLHHLPFKKFQLLDDKQETLDMKAKENIHLSNGDTLAIRPLYIEDGKVCIWLKWKGSDGMQILDTRLHIEPGKNILAGTESAENRATVLAVGVVK